MGLTQTKLHHKVLQENWAGICRRLRTEDGKKWAGTKNPCGDFPLHLACYGGKAPPGVVRALVAAHPGAVHHRNDLGFNPLQLARSNYREGHDFRDEVLDYLVAYSDPDSASISISERGAGEDGIGVVREDTDHYYGHNERNAAETTNPPPTQQQQQHQQQQQLLVSNTDNLGIAIGPIPIPIPANTYVTSTTCVVCLERKADHVVVPCGHLCLCGECAKKVIGGNGSTNSNNNNNNNSAKTPRCCPIGRCEFTSIVRVDVTVVA